MLCKIPAWIGCLGPLTGPFVDIGLITGWTLNLWCTCIWRNKMHLLDEKDQTLNYSYCYLNTSLITGWTLNVQLPCIQSNQNTLIEFKDVLLWGDWLHFVSIPQKPVFEVRFNVSLYILCICTHNSLWIDTNQLIRLLLSAMSAD